MYWATVPETAVDKNGNSFPREDDVWAHGSRAELEPEMNSVAESHGVET
jgi:hypothetical protein